MALTTCKVCSHQISGTAEDCPYCAKMPVIVKCEIAVLIVLIVALMIIDRHIPQSSPIKQPSVQEQEAESTAEVLFNIPKLAGKTEAEVETLLGESVFCAKSESALNCSYREN